MRWYSVERGGAPERTFDHCADKDAPVGAAGVNIIRWVGCCRSRGRYCRDNGFVGDVTIERVFG